MRITRTTALALATAAALPAAALGAVTVTSAPDPAAPAGSVPKIVFTANGIQPKRKYVIKWKLQGERPSTACTDYGSSIVKTAGRRSSRLRFDPLPSGSYDSAYYKPFCAGRTYTGKLRKYTSDYRSVVVKSFTFRGPEEVPGG